MRTCKKCGIDKPLDAFHKNSRTSGRWWTCKACALLGTNAWRQANPERSRESDRRGKVRRRYGASGLAIYERIQAGEGCEVCGGRTVKMAIDHCHDTNIVRGLLCGNCNTALGLLKENRETILALLAYMERPLPAP